MTEKTSSSPPTNPNLSLYIIYVLLVLYALCYQLQSPLEPFLVEKLVGKDKESEVALSYGRLQSVFSFVQMVGSAAFGYILDRFNVRIGFVINFVGCALTYFMLSMTSTIEMLYLSKVPGVAMAGFLCAQTAVSQLTPEGPERVAALGRLTTAYTIGGVVGPYCGGWLGSHGDYYLSAKLAAAASVLAAGMSLLIPVTKVNGEPREKIQDATSDVPWSSRALLVLQGAGLLILVKWITGTANSMASSSQKLILKNDLGFNEADLGMFMSAQFAFGGFANGFLLAPVTKLCGDKARTVVRNCVVIMFLGFCLQGLLAGVGASRSVFIAVAMGMSIFQYSLSTSITAETTSRVPENMKGTLIGLEHCIFSAARILTPAIGVNILNSYGVLYLYGTCASIFCAVLILWMMFSSKLLPDREVADDKVKHE